MRSHSSDWIFKINQFSLCSVFVFYKVGRKIYYFKDEIGDQLQVFEHLRMKIMFEEHVRIDKVGGFKDRKSWMKLNLGTV